MWHTSKISINSKRDALGITTAAAVVDAAFMVQTMSLAAPLLLLLLLSFL